MSSAWIVGAARTPIGKFLGAFRDVSAPRLGSVAITAALNAARVDKEQVEEVIMGNVLSAGLGQAPARQAALGAEIPAQAAALTINKVCGSGLKAVMLADQAIRCGDREVIVAGGMENMSQAPHLLKQSRRGWRFGDGELYDSMLRDGLWCAHEDSPMGDLAEYTANECPVSRRQQDEFAAQSHAKACAAWDAGAMDAEVCSVNVGGKREVRSVDRDEGPRGDCTVESLGRLRPAFAADGSVTPGNASQISDGAAAVVVASETMADALTSPDKIRIVASAVSGGPPRDLFVAPVQAVRQVLHRADWTTGDVDLFEINEAFASQSIACARQLEFSPDRLNIHGGAIALGHPIGASGARVLVTLIHALRRTNQRRGVAALCLGGGNAVAIAVER
ncbi:MAG: acetyl-CoA C-acetyltransferase [Pirellulaceae bacterium]|jgi:acetyl-CoA C-acetyltransferase|nr:acetyl-CoA C-acetyltransferase [Pirellulaceae bacterium]MDP7014470.1 acetyl-CoA C-acetyltransferase [Pirellulaceae bacterium]